jgi:aspartyl-tRNA(Asn)/glutamyl-tRNA(Gln) amidotransferase subunit B
MSWEPVIGIEVHVELMTESKMFCGCRVDFESEPNTNVCPVCLGLPGALPVPNEKAIEWITKIGLAFNCEISTVSQFHRKNYFYSDQPKNYQISQFDVPVCHDGHLEVDTDGEITTVRINRAHMEEDTGKSVHLGDSGRIHGATETMIDFNRSGVPLVEIVTEADIRSAAEARAYAQTLRSTVVSLDVSDAKLEEGSIRFDANISVRQGPDAEFGTKVEIKNMNSFRSLERAVDYEILRQIAEIEAGGGIVMETRHWDETLGTTSSMRAKEGSSDYRYFPEPDLLPIEVSDEWRDRIAASLPELPAQQKARYAEMGLDSDTVDTLIAAPERLRVLLDKALAQGAGAKPVANWLTGEVTAYLRREGASLDDVPLTGAHLAQLATLTNDGAISATAAKEVLGGVLIGEGDPQQVAESRDLMQISDIGALEASVDKVIAANVDAFGRFRDGEDKMVGFLVGQVMKATSGRADPKMVNQILRQRAGK